MDQNLKKQLQDWLETPADKRDVTVGAMLCRRITRNITLGNNYERFPARFGKMVEYQLSKFATVRVKENADHAMVERLAVQAEAVAEKHALDKRLPGFDNWQEQKRIAKTPDFVKGRRADHDSLPEDIQALYTENLAVMQKMRHCRAQLLVIMNTKDSSVCPDADRYPFVKELIDLDAQYRANWQRYDTYTPDGGK
jgi:hypothetical protein